MVQVAQGHQILCLVRAAVCMLESRLLQAQSQNSALKLLVSEEKKGIAVIDRKTMEYLGMIQAPGLTVSGHQIATDAKGNLYVTGVNIPGKANAERLIYKGMSSANGQ